MAGKMDSLDKGLEETLLKLNKDDFIQWLVHPATKVLLIQLDIDLENIKDNWVLDRYSEKEEVQAKGQAKYIEGLITTIKEIYSDD